MIRTPAQPTHPYCMQDATPMVVFVGQIETSMRGREAFQELDYKAVFVMMAKWVVEIDQADRVPAAVAAKLIDANRFVLCFAADGDFQMTGLELGTALQYGPAPVILVLNNGTYGTIRMHQEQEYSGLASGTKIVIHDFTMIAKAYGLLG